jgi:hypothetical protein
MFFFEKKNQKTFAPFGRSQIPQPAPDSAPNEKKFFGSFSQKRTTSLPLSLARQTPYTQFQSRDGTQQS